MFNSPVSFPGLPGGWGRLALSFPRPAQCHRVLIHARSPYAAHVTNGRGDRASPMEVKRLAKQGHRSMKLRAVKGDIMKKLLTSLIAFFSLTLAANAQCASGYTQLSNVFACQLNSAITATNLTSAASNTAASSYTTASISPGANKLDIVSVASGVSSGGTNVPTVTGAGGTWVQIATQLIRVQPGVSRSSGICQPRREVER